MNYITAKDENIVNTFLLAIFFGFTGAHNFYNKKIYIATLQLLSFGGLGIWWLIDVVLIILGRYQVKNKKLVWGGVANEFAGFKVRLCAFIIDMLILKIFFILLYDIGYVSYIFYIIYSSILLQSKLKATIGKHICGIVVIKHDNKNLNIIEAICRQILSFVSFIPVCMGYIMIDFNKRKSALHDYIIKTKVVYR